MPIHEDQQPDDVPEIPAWDADAIMRQRAAATRAERDAAIADLRDSMSDEEIRADFGIDLDQIEG